MIETISRALLLFTALAVCGTGILAQRRTNSAKRIPRSEEVRSLALVRAQSGDTVLTIAERYNVPAARVAQLNRLGVKSKLRKGQRLRVPAVESSNETAESAATDGAEVIGKRIKFTDGATLNVDDAWRQGTVVWFKRGGFTQSLDREVKSIEPIFAARDQEVLKRVRLHPVEPDTAVPSLMTWIYLVGGARFKVDQVNETSDGAWYNRGNLSVFLARERIERIEKDQPDLTGPDGRVTDWTSGSNTIDRLIRTNGTRLGVDPYLVFLVIEQESHFRPRAVSPKGAQGLMQLMPGTARRFGVRRPFEPIENIRGGTQYLKLLLEMFGGRVDLALASYNAGEGRVIQYGHKIPPFRETREYVRRISKRYGKAPSPRKNVLKSPAQGGSGE